MMIKEKLNLDGFPLLYKIYKDTNTEHLITIFAEKHSIDQIQIYKIQIQNTNIQIYKYTNTPTQSISSPYLQKKNTQLIKRFSRQIQFSTAEFQ